MIANINFICDAPGCRSSVTIAPADAKDPVTALENRGWQVNRDKEGDALAVTSCLCPAHRTDQSKGPSAGD